MYNKYYVKIPYCLHERDHQKVSMIQCEIGELSPINVLILVTTTFSIYLYIPLNINFEWIINFNIV